MQQLYPVAAADVDLPQAYAFPDGSPYVRAVFVSSVDGAATMGGRAGRLGNEADRAIFAILRGLADVVLVGAGTARTEQYGPVEPVALWDQLREGRPPTPPVAVVSRTLDFDLTGPLFTATPQHARTIVLTCQTASPERRRAVSEVADVIVAGDDRVEPAAAIDSLARRGYRRISCEGGPRLLAEIAQANYLDELCLTLSPLVLAGSASRITNGAELTEALALRLIAVLDGRGIPVPAFRTSGNRYVTHGRPQSLRLQSI